MRGQKFNFYGNSVQNRRFTSLRGKLSVMDKTLKYRPIIKCLFCGKEVKSKSHAKKGTQRFCSKECAKRYMYKQTVEIRCAVCGEFFKCPIIHKHRKTCSTKCYDKYRGSRVVGCCEWCGRDVHGRQFSKKKEIYFCSKQCSGAYKKWHTEPKLYQKKKIWNNIKNGIDIKCEICHITDIDVLTVHHVDGDKKNNDLSNLQLLCYNCHFKIHHKESKNLKEYILGLEVVRNAAKTR